MSGFQKATKRQARGRIAMIGPSGSGKTYSSLSVASFLGKKIAVIDTEHGSASKYADIFDFDVLELGTFSPDAYVVALGEAAKGGYDVVVIDSLSHAWMGKGGALEMVDNAAKKAQGNSYAGWRDVTPKHNALVEAIIAAPFHVIGTMRSKTEYIVEQNPKTGKSQPRKVGMAPIQRDGMEYEFDVVADLTLDLDFIVSKSRCPALTGQVINKAGEQVADILLAWLSDGGKPVDPPVADNTPSDLPETVTTPPPEKTPPNAAEVTGEHEKMKGIFAELDDTQKARVKKQFPLLPDTLEHITAWYAYVAAVTAPKNTPPAPQPANEEPF